MATKSPILDLSGVKGRKLGVLKTAAKKAGIGVEEYAARVNAGKKRCIKCGRWLPRRCFNMDRTRGDGLHPSCIKCQRGAGKKRYEPIPLALQKPKGPPRKVSLDGDKLQARHKVNRDVKRGWRPNPNDLHCAHCGHKGTDKRHEYHHHMGYSAEHHYDVIALCTTCHEKADHYGYLHGDSVR